MPRIEVTTSPVVETAIFRPDDLKGGAGRIWLRLISEDDKPHTARLSLDNDEAIHIPLYALDNLVDILTAARDHVATRRAHIARQIESEAPNA